LVARLALALAAMLVLAGSLAMAQQPPQPQPQPRGMPGHPPFPGMGQPGSRPPQILGPDGRPQGTMQPGRPPRRPGAPGKPPGFPTQPHRPTAHPAAHEEEHVAHECPGYGPDDPPQDVNLWRGILWVNNERAMKGDFLNRLLFRYEDPKQPCATTDELDRWGRRRLRNDPAPYLASLINFTVLVYILYRFGRKPLADALAKRKESIVAEIETATKLYDDAERRLEEYEDRLENIEDKRESMRAEYAAQAEIEQKHILAEAEERRARMRRDAEFRVEQESKAARDLLLAEAVIAATAAAEALIQKKVTPADHDRMAATFLASIGSFTSAAAPQPGASR
jgi:F-type H+-transporting ATPase subunit b